MKGDGKQDGGGEARRRGRKGIEDLVLPVMRLEKCVVSKTHSRLTALVS